MSQVSFFEHSDFLSHLGKHKDPLEKLNKAINWKQFRGIIDKQFRSDRKSNAGRPPFDYVLMLKVIVLQSLYNLSDHQTEFQILDRYTFKRFLEIETDSQVPDEKTIWLFKERLGEEGIRKIFDKFGKELDVAGFTAKSGSMIDATFVEVPRQRNSREENDQIKNDKPPEDWSDSKRQQKDVDARWTKKNDETHFGYKNHVCADAKHKLIRDFSVTPASTHDSKEFTSLLDTCEKNEAKSVYADSAYMSEDHRAELQKRGLRNRIHEKGYKNKPLTEKQKNRNKVLSKTRVRIEHIFGRMSQCGADLIRSIGIRRARMRIGLINLTYNMNRLVALGGRA